MKRHYLLLPLILLLLFVSCGKEKEFNPETSIKDDADNFFEAGFSPKKIISLAPNITETIYALNADSLLYGVTDYCDFPPGAKYKEKVGSMLDPNIEKITSISPDLIIMTTEGNSKYTYLSLKSSGFRVFVTNPNDINGINRMIRNLGEILGKKTIGDKLAAKIEDEKKYYNVENRNYQPKKCFLLISLNPLISVNKFTYISEVMELAGLDNIYKDELLEYPNINYEDVLIKNPECIFYLCDTTKKATSDEIKTSIINKLGVTDACKNNRVFPVDENVVSRPGPRVMECVKMFRLKVF